jgi:predicted permease
MEGFLQDIRFGARMLRKAPGFTVVAVLALALGIGANSAIFSVVNAILLRPLPYRDAERLTIIYHGYTKLKMKNVTVSPIGFDYYRKNLRSYESIAALTPWRVPANLTSGGDPQRVRSLGVTGNFFNVLGVQPLLGRAFNDEDDQPGKNRVLMLSYGLWQQRFGGDRGIVGKDVTLDGNNYSVIGVMPANFQFMRAVELWVPLAFTPQQLQSGTEYLTVVGRLKPGVTAQQAQAEMATTTEEVVRTLFRGQNDGGWYVEMVPLQQTMVGDVKPALLVLLGAVGFVLLIACANIANLLLARAAARQKEIAIRTALGASRWRTVRQMLTESVLLALIGGGLGLALAYWGLDALLALTPTQLPMRQRIGIDAPVLLFTIGISVFTGLLFGALPALHAGATNLHDTLKEGGRSGATHLRQGARSALVVAEIALAVVLLAGAGLMLKSFVRLQNVNPGFDVSNVLTMHVTLPRDKYSDLNQVRNFYQQLLERVSALPGVEAAAITDNLPLDASSFSSFNIEGKQLSPTPHAATVDSSAKLATTLRIPLIRGRLLSDSDGPDALPVVVIDQSLAQRFWPGQDPIGARIRYSFEGTRDKPIWRTIVGVVGYIKQTGLREESDGQVYIPYLQLPSRDQNIVLRAPNATNFAGEVRRIVQSLDPQQPVYDVRTMQNVLAESLAGSRFAAVMLGVFSGLALLLAAVGIYGVISYSVTQRTHEIGIRMALGAGRAAVLREVVGGGLRLTLMGVGIGLVGALIATRAMTALLFQVHAADPGVFVAIAALLGGVALLACYIPARRAAAVDPMIALRYE